MLIAEWEKQQAVVLAFPEKDTDWSAYLEEARQCVVEIVRKASVFEPVYLLCRDTKTAQSYFDTMENITFIEAVYNDTWMRDCIALSVETAGKRVFKDFRFTAWGDKFDATLDDALNQFLHTQGYLDPLESIDFILEGGAVESDGNGTILTTRSCLNNENRYVSEGSEVLETRLLSHLGAKRVLWLEEGELEGDDTDGHIDTLARFCSPDTIAYVDLPDKNDGHYASFLKMKQQLQTFKQINGKPYNLVALPFVPAYFYKKERLPATYANFLILNGAVLVPTYGVKEDTIARNRLQAVFRDREVIGVDCQVLIRQHGSLHCMTMQLAAPKER